MQEKVTSMLCPICKLPLTMSDRQGVEIDYCPQCRGVWLDRGELDKIILPIRGYGLWSTLYGFMALESDGNTIAGLGFYEHGETPGLGGEVDNPRWKSIWPGKLVYQGNDVAIEVLKGAVRADSDQAQWQVDGLSGATLTTKGVDNLVKYWLGEQGFKPLLDNLRQGEVS